MPSLTVIGDVNIEVIGKLEIPFRGIDYNRLFYGQLDLVIGGTASRFATAARDVFDPIRVLGSVGADELGTWAEQYLNGAGIEARLRRDTSLPTGLAISIWDGAGHGGTRLLLVRADNANHALDLPHTQRNSDCLTQTDFLATDGYCLMKDPRRSSTLHAMRRAAEAGVQVVVDVVPHDCYHNMGRTELREWLANASIVVVEVTTIRRLLQLETPGQFADLPLALQTMESLSLEYPKHSFLLRFGEQNGEQSLVCRSGKEPVHSFTGALKAIRPHNFADQVTAREIRQYFADPE